jgi:hypothetical protein
MTPADESAQMCACGATNAIRRFVGALCMRCYKREAQKRYRAREVRVDEPPLSKRELFAALAMNAYMQTERWSADEPESVAAKAVTYADALLAALDKAAPLKNSGNNSGSAPAAQKGEP